MPCARPVWFADDVRLRGDEQGGDEPAPLRVFDDDSGGCVGAMPCARPVWIADDARLRGDAQGGHKARALRVFDDFDFVAGQGVQFIDERVYLFVGGVYLALKELLVGFGLRGRALLMQGQHAFDERDHAVMPRDVGGVGEINDADGELFDVLCPEAHISTA